MSSGSLAHLRFPVDRSRGRRFPEAAHPYRNDFARDRDRIVHARAFRRLEDKTQVFSPGLHDHFRNRLTHTIEVAQIARTVALSLGLDEDLTEALALAHDIGHPPFAHSGEDELHRQMSRYGDRFDHNLQSLRIVDTVEQHYARFPGLNLTFEVREGIAKHSRDFELGEFPELDEYLPGLRPPLEAQIIDGADEIAYNTADLDDGYSAGMFTMKDIVNEVPNYAEFYDMVETQFAGASERLRFLEALRFLIDFLVTGLLDGTRRAIPPEVRSVDEVRSFPERLVKLTPPALETTTALRQFLRKRVYYSPALIAERLLSSAHIAELFQFLIDNPSRLPASESEANIPVHRRVCDYIAGMTDGYFRQVHAQFSGS